MASELIYLGTEPEFLELAEDEVSYMAPLSPNHDVPFISERHHAVFKGFRGTNPFFDTPTIIDASWDWFRRTLSPDDQPPSVRRYLDFLTRHGELRRTIGILDIGQELRKAYRHSPMGHKTRSLLTELQEAVAEFFAIVRLREPGSAPFWQVLSNASLGEALEIVDTFLVKPGPVHYGTHRVGEDWYLRQAWRRRPAPAQFRRQFAGKKYTGYGLFPRGIQRTLYGSYILYIQGFPGIAAHCGPSPISDENEADAKDALKVAHFPRLPGEGELSHPIHGDAHLADRLVNGLFCGNFQSVGDDRLLYELRWNDRLFGGRVRDTGKGSYRLPDVRASLTAEADRLVLRRLSFQYEEERDVSRDTWLHYTPADGRLWERAKVVFRGAAALDAQLDAHLARGHVLCEHVLLGIKEGLDDRHEVSRLLVPHLDGVDVINKLGDYLIFGPKGCLATTSALSPAGVDAIVVERLAAYDWKGFAPRAPLHSGDRYARAAKAFWEVCESYVDATLGANAFDHRVEKMSRKLTKASPRPKPYRGHPRGWTHQTELGNPSRSSGISRIRNRADLVTFCAWTLFHATFFHTWINDAQWEDAGDVHFAPMGLRGRVDTSPLATHEAWLEEVGPSAMDHGYMKLIHWALTHFDMGYLAKNDLCPSTAPFAKYVAEHLGSPFSAAADDPRLHPVNLRSRLNS